MEKLKILCCPANDGGCSYYRAWSPFQKLEELYPDQVEVRYDKNPLKLDENTERGEMPPIETLEDMKWADIMMTQNIMNYGGPYTCLLYTSDAPDE